MSFIPVLRDLVNLRRIADPNDPLVLTFDCLWNHQPQAIGPDNAVPISDVLAYLEDNGVTMSYIQSQQGPLNETRTSNEPMFIGTNRSGCFLIETREHAEVARDFYNSKIERMGVNRDHLLNQAERVGWNRL